jgi:hypothetical protein
MTDEQFLERLYQIIKPGHGVVKPEEAGAIEALRYDWEYRPTGPKNKPPRYDHMSVRLQLDRGALHKLTEEEQVAVFGFPMPSPQMFKLEDILTIPLGRWSYELRDHSPKYEKRGRPPEKLRQQKRGNTKKKSSPEPELATTSNVVPHDGSNTVVRHKLSGQVKALMVAPAPSDPNEFGMIDIAENPGGQISNYEQLCREIQFKRTISRYMKEIDSWPTTS